MLIGEGVVTIRTNADLISICSELSVSSSTSVDEVADILWFDKGVVLIDNRPDSEMLQVPAQSSPEFFSEELTVSDMEEINEKRKAYEIS